MDGQGLQSPASHHIDSFTAKGHGVPAGAFVVPDPNLLFHGDFKRAGVDLVLSHDGQDYVIHDYFKGQTRAPIASPDGAHLTGDLVNALTGHVQYAQAAPGAAAAQVIGHITKLAGNATAVRNGVSIILNNGDNVEKGDVVSTGSDSTLGITFIDGTVFGLSANARMVLNEMVYDPNGSNNSSLLSLVAGTISFVAGETAKHGDMKIDTPVATMGIRGTAVLSQIEFFIPVPTIDNPQPQPEPRASFQVLVEPDGTTGSYILFDKTTLLPIATVNQAGQMIQISGGNVTVSNALLSPEVQKLISDVFTLKFTDNTNNNTKLTTNFTDTITPDSNGLLFKVNGFAAVVTFVNSVTNNGAPAPGTPDKPTTNTRIPGAPNAVVVDSSGQPRTAYTLTELTNKTGGADPDSVGGRVNFLDFNLGDKPTVKIDFQSFTYQNANHQNVTGGLSNLQQADVAATEIKITVTPDPGNTNNGSAQWSYSVPDSAFDFLAAGEVLTLTYMIRVDNNFADNNETAFIPITITITGTNDKPAITTSVPTITFAGGTSVPGGPLTSSVPTSGTLTFTDVDLTDSHTVSVKLTSATLPGGTVPPLPLTLFQNALSVAIAGNHDSTGSGTGTINWTLADLPVYLADFIPKNEVLTLTYTVTLTDSQGATSTQTIIVTITGTDAPAVVWIATTQAGSPPGGFWKDALNWETGTVPTIDDDVIVITDQLHGLTPSYPVTIDEAAFAKSLTMNDFGGPPPEVINKSSLTIAGALNMSADSILTNTVTGTITVGGKAEILDTSVLTNAGSLTLAGGGDFGSQTTITNSGTLDLSGGTLNLLGTITNTGGTFEVDSGATLALNNGTIDGGTVTIEGTLELDGSSVIKNGTLGNTGAVDVNGTAEFDNETVDNAGGTITIAAAGALVLNGTTVTGGTVTDNGSIHVTGNSAISGAAVTGGGITVDAARTLTLNDTSVTNSAITDNGTVKIDASKTLTLSGTTITGGTVTDNGTIHVTGNSAINSAAVTGGGITVDAIKTLTLNDTTVTSSAITDNGTVKVDASKTLKLNGVTLTGGAVNNLGTVEVTGDSSIVNDAFANTQLTIDATNTLTLNGTTVTGGTVTDNGSIHVTGNSAINGAAVTGGGITVDATKTLTLDDTSITNSAIADNGTVKVDAAKTLSLDGVTLTGGAVNNLGTVEVTGDSSIVNDAFANTQLTIDATKTLTLNGTTVTGGTVTDNGSIHVTGNSAINGAAVTGGGITVDATKTLTLDDTSITNSAITDNGTVKVDAAKTLSLDGVTLTGGAVNNLGTVEITGDSSIVNDAFANTQLTIDATKTLTLNGTTVTGGTVTDNGSIHVTGNSAINGASVTGGGITVDATKTLTLNDTTVSSASITDNGTVKVDALKTLNISGVGITGGALNVSGTLRSSGTSSTTNTAITNNGLIEAIAGLLTLSATTSAAIANSGTLRANGGELDINGQAVTNTGTLAAINDSTLKLISTTVTNTVGTVSVESGSTLDLAGATIAGGTLTIAGTLESTGTSAINDADITNTGTITVTSGTLTIDPPVVHTITNQNVIQADGGTLDIIGDLIINTATLQAIDGGTLKLTNVTVTNSGGTVSTDGTSKLYLTDVTINDGTLSNAGNLYGVSGTNTITAAVTNTGTIEVQGGTLDLAGGLTGAGTLIIDDGATLALGGADAQTVTFAGGADTLQLNKGSGFTGTIAGEASTGGTFTVTGNGDITSTTGDALDFTASGGVTGNAADIVLTPTGVLTGAANGIVVTQNGVGDISLTTGGAVTGLSGDGIVLQHVATGAGDVTATIGASVSGAIGLDVLANGTGDVSITNNGIITGTTGVGIQIVQDGASAVGSTHITNTGSVVGADGEAAISIQENTTGTATIDNSGTIGPDDAGTVTSTTVAIVETGGAVTINNSGAINGNISVATATFNNEAGGTWTVSGTSVFGTLSTIDNAGTIDLLNGAAISSADGLTFGITNSNVIDSWGTTSITGTITNTGTIEVNSGTLTLFGSLSGTGSVTLDADATLKLEGTVTQTVTFSGGNAELEIGTDTFGGTIAGLSATDKIDLTSIKYDIGTTATYDAGKGELTVSDAYGHSIVLKLDGDYSGAHFAGSDDGSGNTLITLNAADDAPAFAAAETSQSTSFAERENVTGSGDTDPVPDATGTIHFTDIDLTDRPTAAVTGNVVTWTAADHSTDLSGSLTSGQIDAIVQALTLQQGGNANNGAIGWTYSIADGALDFLGEDQTVTLVSTVTLDDGQGGTDTAHVTVTITGKNDAPVISVASGDSTGETKSETDGGQTAHGTLTLSDADVTDHVAVSLDHLDVYLDGVLQTDAVGGIAHNTLATYLTLPTGDVLDGTATHTQFAWDFSSNGEAFDFLAAGQTLSLQYTLLPGDGHAATGTGGQVVTIAISGANDAPTLDSATLASVAGNESDPAGSTISDLFAGKFHDDDAGASLKAIAVTADAATAAQGVWQYEVAGSSAWIDIGSVGDDHALVLSPETLIRFVPADGFTGTPGALGVHALDNTYAGSITGASPATIDLTSTGTGGTTPVSDTVASIGTDVTAPAGGPVIDTESFLVSHITENNTDIITDLKVVDTDAGASTDTFTVSAITAHDPDSVVYQSPSSGTLDQINLGFESGITYDPGQSPPDTDQITLTVTDSAGRFDTVHFIFNEAAEGQGLTLQGTDGKDVIFATDTGDTLTGGAAKDQFVFAPGSPLIAIEHTVADFEIGVDKIDLRQFTGVDFWTDVNKTQVGDDTLLTVQDHDTILLKNVLVGNLTAGDFIVTNHGGGFA
ncbi:VCBS domain-containing protein [Bradyrhizobium guangdongense]|uniref:VCBS domain-containing protein n=1 Tax=Bradyrhizobium guangdongense TaxID=1325090 RepID=UPI001FEFD790|nr:VCBS domain-containing protein [Bradyrhizobium guangdongense]